MSSFYSSIQSLFVKRVSRDENGATAVEYGIMVALIAIVIIAAVTLLGGQIKDMFTQTQCTIAGKTYTAGLKPGGGTCA